MEFLRDNGQVGQQASRIEKDEIVRITIIWTYKNKESYEKCQKISWTME